MEKLAWLGYQIRCALIQFVIRKWTVVANATINVGGEEGVLVGGPDTKSLIYNNVFRGGASDDFR